MNISSKARRNIVAINVLNTRAKFLAASSMMDSGALDPYTYVRDRYLGWRRTIVHGTQEKVSTATTDTPEPSELDMLEELDNL